MIGDAGFARVQVAAAEILRASPPPPWPPSPRRTAEEDRTLVLDDDGLVRHRRHIGAAAVHEPITTRSAELRSADSVAGYKDAPKCSRREILRLVRQIGAAESTR